ncbi:MAG: tRNA pseudouridine(38-40) synthase TruA, partial [Bacteroidota bacterium]
MSSSRYFIHFAFDGTFFHGWQRQPNGTTVQEALEQSMTMMLREPVVLTGAGRTDAGVHAMSFYAHFDVTECITGTECRSLVYRLNSYLDPNLSIFEIFPVNPAVHARFSALSRSYTYHVNTMKDPFRHLYQYYLHLPLDLELMKRGAGILMEYQDFTSFSKVDTDSKTNICKISHASWERYGTEFIFKITADRFLRNMVRAIVGTLL